MKLFSRPLSRSARRLPASLLLVGFIAACAALTPEPIDEPVVIVEEPVVIVEAQDSPFVAQRIFFGTDRDIAQTTAKGPEFGAGRANALTLGYTDITIPTDVHEVGSIERPLSVTFLSITLFEQEEDPALHFTVHQTETLSRRAFMARAAEAAAEARTYENTAFVFIHGFNTSFENASYRAAQLAYDLRFDGPAFLYSWPSVGRVADYVTDIDSAENAAPHMDAFLDTVFRVRGVEKVHIIAHSMGNEALAELLKRAGTRLDRRNDKPVDQMILAAPDLDADQFRSIADRFTRVAENVTIYAASTDLALRASKTLRSDYIRLGDVSADGPTVVEGVDSIDVSAIGTEIFSLNHNTYARNPRLLNDMGRLFTTGAQLPDEGRPTIRARTNAAQVTYWQMQQ